jgi:hypothetical protein
MWIGHKWLVIHLVIFKNRAKNGACCGLEWLISWIGRGVASSRQLKGSSRVAQGSKKLENSAFFSVKVLFSAFFSVKSTSLIFIRGAQRGLEPADM